MIIVSIYGYIDRARYVRTELFSRRAVFSGMRFPKRGVSEILCLTEDLQDVKHSDWMKVQDTQCFDVLLVPFLSDVTIILVWPTSWTPDVGG